MRVARACMRQTLTGQYVSKVMVVEEVAMVFTYRGCFGFLVNIEKMLPPINRHGISDEIGFKHCSVQIRLIDSFSQYWARD